MANKRHRNLKISLGSFFGLVIIGGIVLVITQCLKATENLGSSSEPPTSTTSENTSQTLNQHYVYFDLNGYRSIVNPPPQLITEGEHASAPSITRIGYTLLGWTREGEGTYFDFTNEPITSSLTLYASWVTNTYTVTFNLNGGTGTLPSPQSITYLSYDDMERTNVYAIPDSSDFNHGTKMFNGWWIKDSNGHFIQEWNFTSDLPMSDLTLYAGWGELRDFNQYQYMIYEAEQAVKIVDYLSNDYVGGTLWMPDYIESLPVLSIGVRAFEGFMGTDEVSLPATLTTIHKEAFYNSLSPFEITIPSSVTSIGTRAFANCPNLYSVDFNEQLLNIGTQAFYQSVNLGRFDPLIFPNSLLSIEARAFEIVSDTSLLEIPTFGTGLIYIGPYAFSHANFSEVTLPDSLESIGREAFCYAGELAKIHLGKGLLRIANQAFAYANSSVPTYLHVYLDALVPPTLEDAQTFGPFSAPMNNPSRPGLWFIVPDGTVDAYNEDPMWGMYYHGRFVTFMIT